MTLAWFSCEAGASGDMLLGALVDAGAPLEAVQAAVAAVGVEPVLLSAGSVTRQGLAATKVNVAAPRTDVVRTWANLRGLLEDADLVDPVRARALDVFARLARAEATAHGISPEQVHFHEVGALDAVADVVGVCAGVAALGLDRLVASPIALGSGSVRTAHGLLPVPGPAVLALLADASAPAHGGPAGEELATPTGVALVTALASGYGPLPPMRPTGTGTGAGGRDPADRPNVVRLAVGEALAADSPHQVVVLETNVDDLDPRAWPAVLADLLAAGALDAWLTPVLMKKGRPAHVVSALAEPVAVPAVRAVLFRETTTLGIRESGVARQVLARRFRTVDVGGQPVAVKLGLGPDGEVLNAVPEWEDVVRAAAALDRPVKAVLAQALGLAQSLATG